LSVPDKKMEPLTEEEKRNHFQTEICKICKEKYNDNNPKVRDHDHFTGKYRQTICNNCNINLKKSKFVPIIFHNLKGYDSHLIISSIKND
jgi:hypothetical protein